MVDDQTKKPMEPITAVAPGGFARSLYEIFTEPAKVFARIDAGLSWWKAFIVICAVTIATQVTIMSLFQTKLFELGLRARNMSPEQTERMLADADKFRTIGMITAPLAPIIVILLASLVTALFAHVVINLMTSRASYKKTLSLLLWCGLITMVEQIIVTAIIAGRGVESVESLADLRMSIGPAALFPNASGAFMALLQSLSLFQIWYYVVLVLGIAAIFRMKRAQAVLAAVPVWFIGFLLILIGTKFQGGMR